MDRITAEPLSFEGPTPTADEAAAIVSALDILVGGPHELVTTSDNCTPSAWQRAMRESILEE